VPDPKPLVVLRQARGLSQASVAKATGISQTLLWKLEHATRAPKGLRTALTLAAFYDVPVTDIWPEAAPVAHNRAAASPTPLPQHRPSRRAVSDRGVRRGSLKSGGKSKR
jgi:transcriptional regulator with XRE-family HTH domain